MIEFFTDAYNLLADNYEFLLRGVGYTMLIALVGTIAGLLIGLATGVLRTCPLSKNGFVRFLQRFVNAVITVYVEVFRGTPMMVQAMVIYWGYAFATGGQTLPLIPSGILIVSINTDKDAPIFDTAHIAIVGDLYEIVPQMIQKLKEAQV